MFASKFSIICQSFACLAPKATRLTHAPRSSPLRCVRRPGRRRRQRASVDKISAKWCSFSAVSAPIFARKYAFCRNFQNLQDYLADNLANFANFSFCNICKNFEFKFAEFSQNLLNFQTDFLRKF